MIIKTSASFKKEFDKLSKDIRKQTLKKMDLFLDNPQHPSLRLKKVQGYLEDPPIMEFSITMAVRVTCQFFSDYIYLRHIGTHEIFRHP